MRVGYLTSQYPAPSHTFIRREVRALRERGVDVRTFSVRRPGAGERLAEVGRLEEERTFYLLPVSLPRLLRAHLRALAGRPRAYARTLLEALLHRVPGVRALVWALFHFGEAILLADELERQGVEHLHNHFANSSATVAHLAAHFLGIGFSFTVHGISDLDYPAGLLLPAKVRAARFVACATHFGRAQAMRATPPEEWSKMTVVRCGVELSQVAPRRRRGGPLRLLAIGRLAPEKGQLGLIEAFAQATEGTAAELRIIGGGPLEAALRRRIEALKIADRCALLGQLANDRVLAELADSDVLVLSSLMEGLPVVLMEAMAAEVPVIAPTVAGIPELVEHERTGLLFRPGDWSHLAEQLQRLAADPALCERLGRSGAERVRGEFDVRRAVEPLAQRFGASSRASLALPERRSPSAPALPVGLEER